MLINGLETFEQYVVLSPRGIEFVFEITRLVAHVVLRATRSFHLDREARTICAALAYHRTDIHL